MQFKIAAAAAAVPPVMEEGTMEEAIIKGIEAGGSSVMLPPDASFHG